MVQTERQESRINRSSPFLNFSSTYMKIIPDGFFGNRVECYVVKHRKHNFSAFGWDGFLDSALIFRIEGSCVPIKSIHPNRTKYISESRIGLHLIPRTFL